MAINETGGPAATEGTRLCVDCGTTLADGRFCPGCGRPTDIPGGDSPFPRQEAAAHRAADVANESTPAPAIEQEPLLNNIEATARLAAKTLPGSHGQSAPAPGRRGRTIAAVVGGLVVLAAAIAAAVVFLGGSDSAKSQTNAFSDKVATTFAPVDRANRGVSNALTRLRGSRTNSARAAVSRAQRATSSARGALGALTVPDASQQLATQMRQALDREDTYLTAVGTTLARPSSPGVSQLQTLAGNLTSSLEAVGAPISGAAQNVTGADTLGVWAQRARRKRTSQPTGSTTPAPPSPLAGGRDCGGGLHAGPNTTCEFAANVQQAYYEAPGSAATVDVFSPVTGRTYTMDCRPAGSGTTCSGGNGASVSW